MDPVEAYIYVIIVYHTLKHVKMFVLFINLSFRGGVVSDMVCSVLQILSILIEIDIERVSGR